MSGKRGSAPTPARIYQKKHKISSLTSTCARFAPWRRDRPRYDRKFIDDLPRKVPILFALDQEMSLQKALCSRNPAASNSGSTNLRTWPWGELQFARHTQSRDLVPSWPFSLEPEVEDYGNRIIRYTMDFDHRCIAQIYGYGEYEQDKSTGKASLHEAWNHLDLFYDESLK